MTNLAAQFIIATPPISPGVVIAGANVVDGYLAKMAEWRTKFYVIMNSPGGFAWMMKHFSKDLNLHSSIL